MITVQLLSILAFAISSNFDNVGVGIAYGIKGTCHIATPDKRERMFLPFFATKKETTGPGLLIVKKIVDAHHGHLQAECQTKYG